ncbi:hypothetical protein IT403_00365 [Candidatus Nomurabacteria bacterium]|nr:hypothetical protein [Candidatus Nomurabacteria bacterium]
MEQQFQTSFIPKKPLVTEQKTSGVSSNIFNIVGVVVFITSLVAAGGAYAYKTYATKKVLTQAQSLAAAKSEFEATLINNLQQVERRLNASQEILSNHISVSPIFAALQEATLKSVRYTKFSYSLNPEAGAEKVVVKLSGQATNYTSIALQSDLLAKNKYLKNIIFSNLALDEKGNVLFDLTFSVDPSFVSYRINVQKSSLPQSVTPAISQQTTDMNTVDTLPEDNGTPQ